MGSLLHFQFTGSFAFLSNQCSIGPWCFNASLVLRCSGGSSCGERTPYGAPNPLKGKECETSLLCLCGCGVKKSGRKGRGARAKFRLSCWEMFLWAEELQRCERKHCAGVGVPKRPDLLKPKSGTESGMFQGVLKAANRLCVFRRCWDEWEC